MSAKKTPEPHLVYLGLGSNILPEENLPLAVEVLKRHVAIVKTSRVWETPPVGCEGPNYLNAAVLIRTNLPPNFLKNRLLRPIERGLGRTRTNDKHAPRTIDLDILIFDNDIFDLDLWYYAFLAVPVAELFPDFQNTETGETLKETAERLTQEIEIKLRPDVQLP